jgi:hypothetical protein
VFFAKWRVARAAVYAFADFAGIQWDRKIHVTATLLDDNITLSSIKSGWHFWESGKQRASPQSPVFSSALVPLNDDTAKARIAARLRWRREATVEVPVTWPNKRPLRGSGVWWSGRIVPLPQLRNDRIGPFQKSTSRRNYSVCGSAVKRRGSNRNGRGSLHARSW